MLTSNVRSAIKARAKALSFGAGIILACMPAICHADAIGFSLGDFAKYGLLINNGVAGGDINTFPVDANIGVGNISSTINLHNGTVNGVVDAAGNASSVLRGANITGTQPASLGGPAPASVNSNVATVESAIGAANSLSSKYGAEAAFGTQITIKGNTTINASSGFLDSTGTRIFTAPSFSIGNGNSVTVNGSASDYVVVNVTGSSGNKLDGALSLTGGITSDHVLVNFVGSGGSLQGAANGAALSATFLAPDLAITLNSLNILGNLFGGALGTNFQFVSNALISQPAIPTTSTTTTTSSSGNTDVPEPNMVLLFSLGVLGLWYGRKRSAWAKNSGHPPFAVRAA